MQRSNVRPVSLSPLIDQLRVAVCIWILSTDVCHYEEGKIESNPQPRFQMPVLSLTYSHCNTVSLISFQVAVLLAPSSFDALLTPFSPSSFDDDIYHFLQTPLVQH